MFNAHFMRRTKYLSLLMQAREALEQICTKVLSVPRATNEQMELVEQVINRAYTPSIVTGAVMYFYSRETDQHRLKHLGIEPILGTMIMTAVLRAFSVEHHGKQLQHIAESLAIINGAANSPKTSMNDLKCITIDGWSIFTTTTTMHPAPQIVKPTLWLMPLLTTAIVYLILNCNGMKQHLLEKHLHQAKQ